MDDSKALGILRTIAPEFKAVSDDEAQQFLVLSAPLVSRKKFGELYDQAVALLAAHRMKLAGYGISVVGGSASSGGATAGFTLASVGEGSANASVCPDPLWPGVPEPAAAPCHAHHIGG